MTLGWLGRTWTLGRWLITGAALLSGCSGIGIQASVLGSPEDDSGDGGTNPRPHAVKPTGGDDSGADATTPSEDAGEGDAGFSNGMSPLCHVAAGSCNPDEAACSSGGAGSCASGGSCSTRDRVACRVQESGVSCSSDNYMENGGAGGKCTASSDCGIGLECVASTSGSDGTCKPYCCAGVCPMTPTGPQPFCDIEPTLGGLPVPVCTESPSCTPLDYGSCPEGTSCTIVSDSGQTACVSVGKAMAGQECTDQKCGPNLACIGGVCAQICTTHGDPCAPYEACVVPTAFGGGEVGLCTSSS